MEKGLVRWRGYRGVQMLEKERGRLKREQGVKMGRGARMIERGDEEGKEVDR